MTVLEVEDLDIDVLATHLHDQYIEWDNARGPWKEQKRELRDYIFAIDSKGTSNSAAPWRHTTHIPKLCQIRDNLHANYMSALFPREDAIRWQAFSKDPDPAAKAKAIKFYMQNKMRRNDFRMVISKLLYDYIDYGVAFAEAEYLVEHAEDEEGEKRITYQGPRAVRISPFDIVFNPLAASFEQAPQFTRVLKSLGELEKDIESFVGEKKEIAKKALDSIKRFRSGVQNGDLNAGDVDKALAYTIDGFGSYSQYLSSNFVEILIYRGDIASGSGTLETNRVIAVIDRTTVLYNESNESWLGKKPTVFSSWRGRPDNLYGMGPLDNLTGMQFMINHLQNIKADLFDIIAMPPVKVKGQVEEFTWSPLAEIIMGDDGEVDILKIDATALQADTQIAILEQKMDEMAGAPKQAIGARTPGEKTAFEVQVLEQNSNKMFQEKVQQFEIEILEPLLNRMLEVARRNIDGVDLVTTMDDEFGTEEFLSITKEDLTTEGKIVPIGARHFLVRNQTVQNYVQFRAAIAGDPGVMNHISGIKEARMFEDLLGLEQFDLVRDNVRIEEQQASAALVQEASAALQEQEATPADEDQAAAQRL